MSLLIDTVSNILAVLTIGAQIFIVLVVLYFLFFQKKYPIIEKFISGNSIKFSAVIALVATLGSLFYSNVAGFNPCDLCWLQRIFMYPQFIILGLALMKRDKKIVDYSLALAVIGWMISIYHNYIYYKAVSLTFCAPGESCTTHYLIKFGYITIPMMALTAFSLIILFLLHQKFGKQN